jgi:hypothetical protein
MPKIVPLQIITKSTSHPSNQAGFIFIYFIDKNDVYPFYNGLISQKNLS